VGSGKSLTVVCHVMLARTNVVFIFTSGFLSSESVAFLSVSGPSLAFAFSVSSDLLSWQQPNSKEFTQQNYTYVQLSTKDDFSIAIKHKIMLTF